MSADHNGAALQADDLRLEGMRYPVNVHTGSGMALTGTANSTSGSTLEGVQVAILDENDKIVQSAQAQVGGTSFSLKTLDDQIHFGELPTGCYTYMVIVTESSGETLCFASDFTVSDAATSTAAYWSVQDPDGTKLTDHYGHGGRNDPEHPRLAVRPVWLIPSACISQSLSPSGDGLFFYPDREVPG